MKIPTDYQPPTELLNKVLLRLEKEQERFSARQKFWVWTTVSAIITILFSFVWSIFVSEITQSGFADYLTLIFSDFQTVFSAWQDFTLSLLESLPVVAAAGLLATMLTLMTSIRYAAHYSKSNYISLKI